MEDGGGERDGDLGGDSNLAVERELWGVVERGIWGEMGIWLVETVMWRVMERGIWGVGIFAYFAKQGECWERVDGELVLQGNPDIVERGIWGWGSLPILPSMESSGREWRGNWYYRGTCTL